MASLPLAGPGTALLLDAAGTLLHPAEPVSHTYARIAVEHGASVTPEQVAARFGASMKRAASLRLGSPDWRPFWRVVVRECTGSDDAELLEVLIGHFRRPGAWRVAAGAQSCCERVRAKGMKVAVVSNWDHNLRALLEGLGGADWVDAIVVSAEEQIEKPDPRIFLRACAQLGVPPHAAVHVGDDPHDDIDGAKSAGCAALRVGHDIADFDDLAGRLM
jgi:REG-2-like HAD superfamily hydrolase